MLLRTIVFAVIGFVTHIAIAETITLNDGSVIKGQVSALSNGIYTINTNNLGVIKVEQAKVSSISHAQADTVKSLDVQALQQSIMQNPKIMKQIKEMQNNPTVQAILSDPKIMQAIANGDYQSLLADPKMQQLMNDPQTKAITNQFK